MAEVVETYDLTTPSQDGWAVDYRIRREDGEELHAEVRCWERRTLLPSGQQTLTLLRTGDRGLGQRGCARARRAGGVPGDAWRGADLDLFDPADEGNLRRRVSYERAPG